jgi:hypothetical protein
MNVLFFLLSGIVAIEPYFKRQIEIIFIPNEQINNDKHKIEL